MDPVTTAHIFATAPVPWIVAAGAGAAVSALSGLCATAPASGIRTATFLGGIGASFACLIGGLLAAGTA